MQLAILLTSVGIILALIGFIAIKRERKIASTAEITEATVISYDRNYGAPIPVVEFTAGADVVKLSFKEYTGEKLEIGEKIEVGYTITTVNGQQYYKLINLYSDLPASKPILTVTVIGAALVLLGLGIAIMSAV